MHCHAILFKPGIPASASTRERCSRSEACICTALAKPLPRARKSTTEANKMPWLPSYGLCAILLWPTALAQTSTVVVIPTPLIWQDAQAYCGQIGHTIYPVPATPTDAVYDVLEAQSSERFWIRRRTGGSCTCLNRDGSGDKLEEAPCGDALPFFCKDCSHGGDGC